MQIILQLFDHRPDNKETTSRLPRPKETGPLMERLMRVISGVNLRVSFSQMLDWNIYFQNQINVWGISSAGPDGAGPIYAKITVDCVGTGAIPMLEENLYGGYRTRFRVASANGRVFITATDDDLEKEITNIANKLKEGYKQYHSKD